MMAIEGGVMRISQDCTAGPATNIGALPLASHAGAEKQLKFFFCFFCCSFFKKENHSLTENYRLVSYLSTV
jgi:hypothetical protein